jgi:hypothetical protein
MNELRVKEAIILDRASKTIALIAVFFITLSANAKLYPSVLPLSHRHRPSSELVLVSSVVTPGCNNGEAP